MMTSLVRRDPAVRALFSRALAVVLLGGGLVLNVMMFIATRGRQQAGIESGPFMLFSEPGSYVFALQISLVWLLVAVFLLLAGAFHRCGPFDLALPIPARALWRSRLAGRIIGGTAVLVLMAVLMNLGDLGLSRSALHARFLSPRGVVTLAAHLFAGLCLAAALMGSIEIGLSRVPRRRRVMIALAGALLGTLAVILTLSAYGPITAVVPLILAGWVARRTEKQLPPMFALHPRDLEASGMGAQTIAADRAKGWNDDASSPPFLVARVVWRALYGHILGLLLLGVVLFYAFFLSGGAMSFGDENYDTGPSWIPILWYLLLAFVAKFMKKLYVVDALPISRRYLFAALTLPGLVVLLAGYGVGKAVFEFRNPPDGTIILANEEGHADLLVSLEYFRITWNGETPPLTSPWGETHEAKTVPFFSGSTAALYKPYTTPAGSSPDFVALQLSRALEDIYGLVLGLDEVREQYLITDTEGVIALRDEGAGLAAELAAHRPHGRGHVFPMILVAVVVPWLLMLALLLRGHRMGLSLMQQKMRVLAVMGIALLAQMGLIFSAVADLVDLWVFSCVFKSLSHQLVAGLPGGMATLWVLAFIIIAAFYRLAETSFKRVEASPEQGKSCSW